MSLKAFNGDTHLVSTTKDLIKKYDIDTIIETGTYMGDTTELFAQLVPDVYTIEISKTYYEQSAAKMAGMKNVKRFLGSSNDVLRVLFGLSDKLFDKCLLFLDAHWNEYNPLLDEL